jgi:hypothetical protein
MYHTKYIKFSRTQKISNFHAHKKYQIFTHTKNIKFSRTQKYQIFTHTKYIKFSRTQNISNFHAHKIHQIFMHTKYITETEVRRRSGYMNVEVMGTEMTILFME